LHRDPRVVRRHRAGLQAPLARGPYDDTMHHQGRWARWVPAALLTVCTVAAFVLQFLPVVAIGAQRAGNHDVASGGCGWDGTCSDEGVMAVTMWCALGLVVAELAVGGLLGTAKRFAITIMAGCLVSWVVMFQNAFVMSQAAGRDLDDQGRGSARQRGRHGPRRAGLGTKRSAVPAACPIEQ
jgi:hypothetical protein